MILLGIRPHTVGECEQYETLHRRMSIRLGMTGICQVSGGNDVTDFEEVVKLSLKLLVNTVLVVVFQVGAKLVGTDKYTYSELLRVNLKNEEIGVPHFSHLMLGRPMEEMIRTLS